MKYKMSFCSVFAQVRGNGLEGMNEKFGLNKSQLF